MRHFRIIILALLLLVLSSSSTVFAGDAPKVYFKSPLNGATVTSPVKVEMMAENIKVSPAGEIKEGEGHHHIIIDGSTIKKGEVVPADATHLHFGKGQTEAEIPLSPGKHSLTLQFADGAHKSYGEGLSSRIEVTVK